MAKHGPNGMAVVTRSPTSAQGVYLSTTEHNVFATPSQDYSVIMADGSHGSAVHGVAGSPVLLKGASSNGTMSTGTLPSSVTANISSVSVIVPATPPGGESIFLHVLLW